MTYNNVYNPLLIALAEDILSSPEFDKEEAETLFDELCDYLSKSINGWVYHVGQVREYAQGHPKECICEETAAGGTHHAMACPARHEGRL